MLLSVFLPRVASVIAASYLYEIHKITAIYHPLEFYRLLITLLVLITIMTSRIYS